MHVNYTLDAKCACGTKNTWMWDIYTHTHPTVERTDPIVASVLFCLTSNAKILSSGRWNCFDSVWCGVPIEQAFCVPESCFCFAGG